MNHRVLSNRVLVATLLIAFGVGLSASWAQMPAAPGGDQVRIRRMTPAKEKTPIFRTAVQSQTAARQQDWWRVVVDFETAPDWIDELECTYYVYMRDQSNKGAEVMFRGAVTYVNVPKGRHQSDIFLHPSTLARMGTVEQVAVVMKNRGAVVGTESTAKTPNWWERFSPVDGVLLNRSQTPFAFVDYDSFNAIKPVATSAR